MFQRAGSTSNAHVGKDFEQLALSFFQGQGIHLRPNFAVLVGAKDHKKSHCFDFGCENQKIIVECKSHKWTSGSNIPSAKLTVWNEAMYYFSIAPADYKKILFVLHDDCSKRKMSLAEYYYKTYRHMIPNNTEIFEFCESEKTVINAYK